MSKRDLKDPSLRSVAADVAGAFLVRKNADLCKEFIDYMIAQGAEYAENNPSSAGGSRAKNNFDDFAGWLSKALRKRSEAKEETIPTDPIEARIYRKRMERAQRSLSPKIFELGPNELDAILNDETEIRAKEKRENEKKFITYICDLATKLSEQMMVEGNTMGVTELQQPPRIVEAFGFKGVLVQSFTVEKNGDRFKCDFKANQRAVNIGHPDIIQTLDNNRLIRSNKGRDGYIKGAHEFYVKGLRYEEGMVFMQYMCANGEDQLDLANYYQIDNGKVVATTFARWKEVENLLAAGRDPSESLRPKSVAPKSGSSATI
jgi:hypothetical protein